MVIGVILTKPETWTVGAGLRNLSTIDLELIAERMGWTKADLYYARGKGRRKVTRRQLLRIIEDQDTIERD